MFGFAPRSASTPPPTPFSYFLSVLTVSVNGCVSSLSYLSAWVCVRLFLSCVCVPPSPSPSPSSYHSLRCCSLACVSDSSFFSPPHPPSSPPPHPSPAPLTTSVAPCYPSVSTSVCPVRRGPCVLPFSSSTSRHRPVPACIYLRVCLWVLVCDCVRARSCVLFPPHPCAIAIAIAPRLAASPPPQPSPPFVFLPYASEHHRLPRRACRIAGPRVVESSARHGPLFSVHLPPPPLPTPSPVYCPLSFATLSEVPGGV